MRTQDEIVSMFEATKKQLDEIEVSFTKSDIVMDVVWYEEWKMINTSG